MKKSQLLLFNRGGRSTLYNNLVAYWTLNEASEGSGAVTRADSVGSSNLTDNNTCPSAEGKLGNAVSLTAANNENLSVADNATLSMGDVDFSIAAWVYPAAQTGAYQFMVCKYNASAGRREYYLAMNASNLFEFAVRNTADAANTTATATEFGAPTVDTWYLVIGSHDSTANKIYLSVNAGTRIEAATSGGVLDGTSAFRIGASDQVGGYFGGRVDSVAVWKGRVLTVAEEAELYNGGAGKALY